MLPPSVRIFVCTVPQDKRRSFDALALARRQLLGEDPEGGGLFIFVNWRQTLEQSDAQQQLAANPFRRITLDRPLVHCRST